jgi:hypothetical protein
VLLAERLRTALQIEMHLTLAFEHAFRLADLGVTTRSVQNRTVSRKANKISDLPNRSLANHDHSWRQIAGLSRSKPSLVAYPRTA